MPAISLAYEDPEGDVMKRPPRNARTDKLVTRQTLAYSYLQAGVIETLAGFFAFFMVFYAHGVPSNKLFFSANDYWGAIGQSSGVAGELPYTIKDGARCDLECQTNILAEAQSAYFINVVMGQVLHIYLCKTRKVSVFDHGFFHNHILTYGVVISILLMMFLIYVPFMNPIMQSLYVHGWYWLIVPGTWMCLLALNEGQKWYTRGHPKSWVASHMAW